MVGGLQTARSVVHLAELFRLADRAGCCATPSWPPRACVTCWRSAGDRVSRRWCQAAASTRPPPSTGASPRRSRLRRGRHRGSARGGTRCRDGVAGARLIRDAGLRGHQPVPRRVLRRAERDASDNRRAIEEAAALGHRSWCWSPAPPADARPRRRARDGRRRGIGGCCRTPPPGCGWRSSRCTRCSPPTGPWSSPSARRSTSPSGSTAWSAWSSTCTTSGGTRGVRADRPRRRPDPRLPGLRLVVPAAGPAARPRDDGRRRHRVAAAARGGRRGRLPGPIEVEIFNQRCGTAPGDQVLAESTGGSRG